MDCDNQSYPSLLSKRMFSMSAICFCDYFLCQLLCMQSFALSFLNLSMRRRSKAHFYRESVSQSCPAGLISPADGDFNVWFITFQYLPQKAFMSTSRVYQFLVSLDQYFSEVFSIRFWPRKILGSVLFSLGKNGKIGGVMMMVMNTTKKCVMSCVKRPFSLSVPVALSFETFC